MMVVAAAAVAASSRLTFLLETFHSTNLSCKYKQRNEKTNREGWIQF